MTGELAVAAGLLFGGAAYLALAGYVARRRRASGAVALLVSLVSIFIWSACYAIELRTRSVATAQVWSCLKYIGIVGLPPSLLAFAVEYTGGGRRLTRRTLAVLAIEPAIILSLMFVPKTHDLVLAYRQADIAAARLDRAPVAEAGILFWPHAFYSWVLLLSALWLLVARLARIARPYRRQAGVVVVASVLPFGGNIVWNVFYNELPFDPTPFLFILLAVVLVWGFLRLQLLDLVTVARGAVMEQMTDAVLVLDAYARIVDANPAAVELVGARSRDVIGHDIRTLLPAAAGLVDGHLPGAAVQGEIVVNRTTHVAVQLTSLTDRQGAQTGRLLVLRDVTERTATERRLRELLDAETHLAAVLQTSLRPASLPLVPGMHLAARSVPAGEGTQVSGDFYDVHQALGGDWAFVLGDVAGKGVHAAVVTSMARYTVRTLSAQGWSPKQVLEQLNQALLVEAEPERFCTVVYARLGELDPAEENEQPQRGVRVTVALGGHPAPLVRRGDGTIEAVGRPGTALGIVSLVDLDEVRADLYPGDVLVAFTDGVTEARRDGEEFGETRLAETLASAASGLRGSTGQAAAALVAEAVADRIVEAVTVFASHRDDVAVLVLAVS